MDNNVSELLRERVKGVFALTQHCRVHPAEFIDRMSDEFYGSVEEDLAVFSARNPAAAGAEVLAFTSVAFDAVLCHRISNYILCHLSDLAGYELLAFAVYESSYGRTGIDIHPRATIGRRFIVDHGWGLVIGETCEIGSDCYLLGGAILGALGISRNASGKRHPTLGNNVQVGQHTRLLGPVTIGDNVVFSPNCVIVSDVPSNTNVTIINQLQFTKTAPVGESVAPGIKIYGVVPLEDGFEILGDGLTAIEVVRLELHGKVVPSDLKIQERSRTRLIVHLTQVFDALVDVSKARVVALSAQRELIVITHSLCMDKYHLRHANGVGYAAI